MLPFFLENASKSSQNEEKVRFFSSGRASEKNLSFGRNFWSRPTVASGWLSKSLFFGTVALLFIC